MSDETLEALDETIKRLKLAEEMDMDTTRSEVVRGLVKEWLAEHQEVREGNGQMAATISD